LFRWAISRIATRALENEATSPYLEPVEGSRFSAAELLALNEPEERSKLSEAEALLRAELEDGPRPVSELRAAAGELGISITTLNRAKKQIGAGSIKLDLDRWVGSSPRVTPQLTRLPRREPPATRGSRGIDAGLARNPARPTSERYLGAGRAGGFGR